jgi:hypothetical protein
VPTHVQRQLAAFREGLGEVLSLDELLTFTGDELVGLVREIHSCRLTHTHSSLSLSLSLSISLSLSLSLCVCVGVCVCVCVCLPRSLCVHACA